MLQTELIALIIIIQYSVAFTRCPRDYSKLVRRLIKSEILPLYGDAGVEMPQQCLLQLDRDIYGFQEDNKVNESPSRWICDFCGKAFYEERFVEKHFEMRHPQTERKGDGIVCLADFCDIFRCDIISGNKKLQYWDKALCKEEEIKNVYNKCLALTAKCIPSSLSGGEKQRFKDMLNKHVCSYLNCQKYWELPDSEISPMNTVVYIVMFMVLVMGLLLYYYIAYTHFYTDESIIEQYKQESEPQYRRHYPSCPGSQEIRYRSGVVYR